MPRCLMSFVLVSSMKIGQRPREFNVIVTTRLPWVEYLPHADGSIPILLEVLRDGSGIGVRAPVLVLGNLPHVVGVWSPAGKE